MKTYPGTQIILKTYWISYSTAKNNINNEHGDLKHILLWVETTIKSALQQLQKITTKISEMKTENVSNHSVCKILFEKRTPNTPSMQYRFFYHDTQNCWSYCTNVGRARVSIMSCSKGVFGVSVITIGLSRFLRYIYFVEVSLKVWRFLRNLG